MNVLVTGATGFLGKQICKDLLKAGHQVYALGRQAAIGEQLSEMGCHFIQADLRDSKKMQECCQGIDSIIHSGALSSPWGKEEDFFQINVQGTINLLEAATSNQVKSFVYISSSSVYFNFQDRFNILESDSIANPAPSLYTKSKIAAEKEVMQYHQQGKIKTIILRPRGIFGPGDTTLIPRIINAHDKGRLPIIGDGNVTVDVTYVDNVSNAALLAINASSEAYGEIYNITNGEPTKLWGMIEYILKRCGRTLKKKHIPFWLVYALAALSELRCKYITTKSEPTLTRYTSGLLAKSQTLNIDKARKLLGYHPDVNMDQAIENTLAWYLESQV